MTDQRPAEPGPEIEDDDDLMADDPQNTQPSDDDTKVPGLDRTPKEE